VASDVGGIADIVVDGETGLLTRPGDAASIAGALVRLLDDDALRTRLGAAARRRMEEHFDARLWARNLLALYREVRERGRRGATRS
jgi:glycosyltransferase involved in cell wall biosynthesis